MNFFPLKLTRTALLAVTLISLFSCTESPAPLEDIDKLVAEMRQRVQATTEMEKRGELIPRYNQPKTIACLSGQFTVHNGLPRKFRHGLFSNPATYPVTARFASASKWDDSEKDIRGLSIRVTDVPGDTLWGSSGAQDFLLNSYPSLFVASPEEFLSFMRARQTGEKKSLVNFFLNPFDPHIKSLMTVLRARAKHVSPLDIRYWSTVPSALDNELDLNEVPDKDTVAVKYSATPCSNYITEKAVEPGENQLRAAIKTHLTQATACFEFGLQLQTNSKDMPIEDASVIWDEDSSPFVTVATLNFEEQSIDDVDSLTRCEQSHFNPWQTLPAHTPLGRMNAVRKAVYAHGNYQRANR